MPRTRLGSNSSAARSPASRATARTMVESPSTASAVAVAGLSQLALDALPPDLVELVQDDEELAVARSVDPAVRGHRGQDAPVVHTDPRLLEPERDQGGGGRQDELDLGDLGGHAQDVDVALDELAEAALLRPLGPPHRSDLDRLERVGQDRPIVGVVPRERHREVEAEPEIGEIVLAVRRRIQLRAALEYLVDQLLVLAAAAAEQELQILERGRLDATEPVALVRGQDRGRRPVAKLDLGREQVLHAARRRRVELHARVSDRTKTSERVLISAVE